MNRVFPILIAAYSLAVGAQSAEAQMTDKEKQRMVDVATIDIGYGRRAATQQESNVAASKKVSSMSTPDKNQLFKDINTKMVNAENPSGVSGMAEMQRVNVEASQEKPPQAVNLSFAAYQAYSSDSLQFKLPPDSNMPAFATADGATVAKQAATPTRRTGVEPTGPTMSSRSN